MIILMFVQKGLHYLPINAKWDKDYKIDEIIDKYLRHITDVKPKAELLQLCILIKCYLLSLIKKYVIMYTKANALT